LDSNPDFVRAWVMLGFTQARMGQADAFLEQYGEAPVPFLDADSLLSRFETPTETVETASPKTMPPWLELATMCVRNNLWDEAATYLLHAGANSGDPRLPLLILVDLARELGNVERYGRFLIRATEEHPDEPLPWLMICDASIQAGNAAAAAQAFEQAKTHGATVEELAAREPAIEELRKGGIDTIETVI